MEIIQEKVNDVAIVEIKGRLDVTTASDLEQVFTKLLSENQNKVLVECRELEYIRDIQPKLYSDFRLEAL